MAFETLYGGAAGGGKSDLLLGLAFLRHRRVLLLRRTFPDLERSLIVRSLELYGSPDCYNQTKHVWKLPGLRIEFGHLEHEKTIHQYQSAQYDLVGFDELTQFTRLQYEYLLSRARTVARGQRVRVVACTNPGGEGNDWVMARWAAWLDAGYPHPAAAGEVRWFKRLADNREVEASAGDPAAISRTFIAARLGDNPYLDEHYRQRLGLLPEPFRSQLLNGDWQVGLVDDVYQVIPTAWIQAAQARWTARDVLVSTAVGVDVARGGDDQTVLARRMGGWFAELIKVSGRQTPTGQVVVQLLAPWAVGASWAMVDVIGVGASAYDLAVGQGLNVIPINFAAKSTATDVSGQLHFVNLRAEAYWRVRDALDPAGGRQVALPPDAELLGDLRAQRWRMQTNGIALLSKDEVRRALGRSPDCGDAVALALLLERHGSGVSLALLPEDIIDERETAGW